MVPSSAPGWGAGGAGTGAAGAGGGAAPCPAAVAAPNPSNTGGVAELAVGGTMSGSIGARALVVIRARLVSPAAVDLPFWAAVAFLGGIAENITIR